MSVFDLNIDVAREIFNKCDLLTQANLSKVCKVFHNTSTNTQKLNTFYDEKKIKVQ